MHSFWTSILTNNLDINAQTSIMVTNNDEPNPSKWQWMCETYSHKMNIGKALRSVVATAPIWIKRCQMTQVITCGTIIVYLFYFKILHWSVCVLVIAHCMMIKLNLSVVMKKETLCPMIQPESEHERHVLYVRFHV